MKIYTVDADFYEYLQLVNDSDWQLSQPFLWGKHLENAPPLRFRYRTLEEDQQEDEVDQRLEEPERVTAAADRHKRMAGDCTNVLHFTAALVFSAKAQRELSTVLDPAGQFISVNVEGDTFFIYNCTRLLDACISDRCVVDYGASSLGGQRPGEIPKLVVKESVLTGEYLFKLQWPKPPASIKTVDYSKIPPPTDTYATQQFVDLVADLKLTGFVFHLAGTAE